MDDLNIQAGVTVNAEQAERAFTALGDKAQKMANEVTKAADKAGKATDGMGDGAEKGADKFTRAESRMRSAIQKSTRELEMLGKTASQKFEAQLEFKGLDKAKFQPFLDELRKTEEAAAKAREGVSGIGDAARVAGSMMAAAFSGAALLGMVGKVVAVQREFDVLNSSLKTVTGSSAAAEREMAWLKDFAKETPFGLAQATQGFVKMKALGLDPTRAALTSFGNTASAMGKDLNQMIEAVADASTGEFERLKEFGIKAKKEGDQVSLTFQGVTTTIGSSAREITKYLEDIGNTSFGGAMEERAKTLDGTIAALGDTWDELFRTVSTNNVGSLIFDSVTLANGVLEEATTILRAMGGAAQDASRDTGALSTIQNGIATVFETVAVLGANLKYVLVQIGNEIGGLAAQVAQAARFNFAGVAAIRRQMVADAEAARKEIDATTARILNARKEQEEYARWATRNASAANDPRRLDIGTSKPRSEAVGSTSSRKSAVDAEARAYENLIKSIQTKIATEEQELAGGEKLTDSQRLRVQFAQELQTSLKGLSAAKVAEYTADLDRLEALERENTARKEFLAIAEQERQQRLKIAQAAEQSVDSLATGNQQLRDEIQLIGLSATEQMEVLRLREESVLLVKEQHLAEMKRAEDMTGTMTRERIALEQEIELRRERLNLMGQKAQREQFAEFSKQTEQEWRRTVDQYGDVFRQGFADMLNNGEDGWKSFTRSLVTTFKTTVADQIYKMFAQPFVVKIVGSLLGLTGASAASAATGGGGVLSAAGNAASVYSAFTSVGGNVGAISGLVSGTMSLANAAGSVAANAASMTGAVDGLSALLATNGAYGTAATAGSAAAASSTAGAASGGASGALASIPGWGWALGGILLLGAIFGGKKSTPHMGGAGSYSADGGASTGLAVLDQGLTFGVGERYYNSEAEKAAVGISQGIVQMLDSTAQSFGQQAGYYAATAFADDSSKDGAWGSLIIRRDDEKVLDWADTQTSKWAPKVFADGEQGQKEYLAAIAASARDALVQAIGSVDWATDMLTALGDSPTLESLAGAVTQINAAKVALDQMGKNLVGFSSLTDAAVSALVKAAGGIEGLVSAASTYYDNFYTEAEKTANVTRDITAALADVGLQMPATREDFRALVESQMALGDAGMDAVAALLKVSGAFASVTAESETAAAAAARLADEQAKAAEKAAEAAARAAEKAAEDAARAYEKTLAYLTKTAETAMQILGAAVDREKQSQQANYQAQTAIIDAQRKAATTAMDAQRVWMGVAIGGAQSYAKALESEAARIRGYFTGMVLQDNPDAPAGASVFAAQAALRAGDKSDAVLRKATDIDPEMFASWADYAVNFFETQGLVRGATQDAERAASMAYSDVALLEQQLTLAEDKYKADLEHYTKLEGIAKETLDSNLLRLDALVQSAQDQLAEATGTKLAVMTIAQAMGNFSGAIGKLAGFTGNPITTPLPTAPVLTPFGAQTPEPTIAPVVYNPVSYGGGQTNSNDKVVAALRDVVAELQALRSTGADTKAAVEKTSAILDQVTAGGNAMLTETA